MREVLKLRRMVQDHDVEKLRKRIKWGSSASHDVPYFLWNYPGEASFGTPIPTRKKGDNVWLENTVHGNVGRSAVAMIGRVINDEIRGLVTPQLRLLKPHYKELGYELVPLCLQGALWLQVLNAVMQVSEKTRACADPGCRKTFEYKRTSKLFCSDACRKRFYRRSQKEEGT